MRFSFLGEAFGAGFFAAGLPFLVALAFAFTVVFAEDFADDLALARVVALTLGDLAAVGLTLVDLAAVDFVDLALAVVRVRADAEVVREPARDVERDALATPRPLAFFAFWAFWALAASRRLACLTSDWTSCSFLSPRQLSTPTFFAISVSSLTVYSRSVAGDFNEAALINGLSSLFGHDFIQANQMEHHP